MSFLVRQGGGAFLSCSLVAGFSAPSTGYNSFIPIGSLSPGTLLGATINAVFDNTGAGNHFAVLINGNLPQNFFSGILINGNVFTTASATWTFPNPYTSWSWGSLAGLLNGNTYPVVFTY